jgi:uncharacterized protein YcfJ
MERTNVDDSLLFNHFEDEAMRKQLLLSAAMLSAGLCSAQDAGRVISSTPIVQQVAVPRQVCSVGQAQVHQPNSGAGALAGAIAGGAVGNSLGHGPGQAAATMLGAIAGAALGNNIESSTNTQVQDVQRCQMQTFYENATIGYNVVYEFAGKQYAVQMANDPGASIRLQVSPVGASAQAPATVSADAGAQTVYLQPANVVVAPATVYPGYYYPPYYQPYYPLLGLSLGFGFGGGGHRWR